MIDGADVVDEWPIDLRGWDLLPHRPSRGDASRRDLGLAGRAVGALGSRVNGAGRQLRWRPMLERTARWAVAIECNGSASPSRWAGSSSRRCPARSSQVVGVTPWRIVAVLQALTPYLLLPSVPLATVAFWCAATGRSVSLPRQWSPYSPR